MALDTRLAVSTENQLIHHKVGSGGRYVERTTTGTDIFISAIVTGFGETGDNIDLCASTEAWLGVVVGLSSDITNWAKDSDSPYAAGVSVHVYIPLPGEEIWLTTYASIAIAKDAPVSISGSGAGFVANGAISDDAYLGNCVIAVTATASTEKNVLVRWK